MDLSVIILSYNTKDITSRCLKHLKEAKLFCQKKLGNKIEVIVVDNASEDGSVQMIKQNHSWVKLIESKENTGFSKGNNLAMEQSRNPYMLLLNSDVYLQDDSLYRALAYFRVNLKCDVMGARLKYASGVLQPSAGNLPNPLNIISWILGLGFIPFINRLIPPFHPKEKGFFSKAHQVGWIMGAFFALKQEVFEKTQGFDENLFMHMEEVEWCRRIKNRGYKIWYNPQVEVVHLHGASTNFDLSAGFLNELKGIKYYLKKHYPNYFLVVKLFLGLGLTLRVIIFFLIRKTGRAKVYLEGLSYV